MGQDTPRLTVQSACHLVCALGSSQRRRFGFDPAASASCPLCKLPRCRVVIVLPHDAHLDAMGAGSVPAGARSPHPQYRSGAGSRPPTGSRHRWRRLLQPPLRVRCAHEVEGGQLALDDAGDDQVHDREHDRDGQGPRHGQEEVGNQGVLLAFVADIQMAQRWGRAIVTARR